MNVRSLALTTLLALSGATTQAAFTYTGAAITENFDGINVGATTTSSVNGVQFVIAGTGFDGTRIAGAGTTANPALPFSANDGSSATGSLYSYGATGATDRALGTLSSGSNTPGFGVAITNGTGSTLSSFTLTFDREQYRSSTSATSTPNTITFAYGISGGAINASNYLTAAGLLTDSRFNLVGDAPVSTSNAGNGAISPPSIIAGINGTINLTIAAGQTLFLRFSDVDDQGNDAGLAIDNFRFTATPAAGGGNNAVPEPASVALLGLGLAGLVAARRRMVG